VVRAGHKKGVLMRRFMILLSLLLLVVGCSPGSDSADIAFNHGFDRSTEISWWTATGEAIDNDLLCSKATGVLEGFEDEDGAVRQPEEIGALHEAGEPFVNVSVELLTCDDGSGEFTLRFNNQLDPAISNSPPVVASTWTITGGTGYVTTEGAGDSKLPAVWPPSIDRSATGTISSG
jgi:hypothetical protein